MKLLLVSAAILMNEKKEILLTERPHYKVMPGYWEFPGGKMENGETPEATIIRELKEELGIEVHKEDLVAFTFASHSYEKFHLLMPIFTCSKWQGKVTSKEQQNLSWVKVEHIKNYNLLPADIPVVKMIQQHFQSML